MRKLKNSELNRISIEAFKVAPKTPLIIVLDNVRSLNNIGSIFRTADAFLIEAIYLCGITAQPPHKDIQKTALGATESVDWKYFKKTLDAIEELSQNKYHIIALEQADRSIRLEDFTSKKDQKYALILGNEVNGIEDEVMKLVDESLEIPQFGTKHSLNIAVSAGIAIWEIFKNLEEIK